MLDRKELLHSIFPFLNWTPLVTRKTLRADLLAGLTGAIIVLPQGVAFAMIAGMPPVYGLYTAIVVPIVAALFGSSMHLISGPTTAISLVVFSAISELATPGSPEFIQLALVLTFLAGVFQLGLGLARLGMLTNFVSHTVVIGFTAGAALLIATSQMKHALGINVPQGEGFFYTWRNIVLQIPYTNLYELGIGLATLLTALLMRRISKKIPHLLVAILVGSALAAILGGAERGIRFVQEMPSRLPPFDAPELSIYNFRKLSSSAFAVALLGLIEAVAIARAIGTKTRQRIDGSQEFIGQGLSNIVGSFFSSYAGSGSFTRSGVNHSGGAVTPMSAIFAALILAIFLLLVAPWASYLPMAAMGGLILLVAFNLIDFHHIRGISKSSKKENAVLITTFLATIFFELEFAIYIGVFLSLLFYLQRTSKPHVAIMAPDPSDPTRHFTNVARKPLTECPQLKVVRIDGSLYYGAVDHVASFLAELSEHHPQRHLLILANGINFVDITGAEFLVQEAQRWRELGGDLYICGLKLVAQDVLISGGYRDEIGEDHFFKTKSEAIPAIYKRLDPKICETCEARVFLECNR
ncbi:MAG: SulP family inorganic anion transporter [Saprospirales bacterium]|nr:SulP family inorganic anion transporter [Saprospirales bacterium]MBK6905454.1 SulP family inorganic anion transporter [Saprospirales bacterium]